MSEPPVAIVTAAGKGMGEACARELAQRGYALALMSPSGASTKLAKELGGIGLDGSVTDPSRPMPPSSSASRVLAPDGDIRASA